MINIITRQKNWETNITTYLTIVVLVHECMRGKNVVLPGEWTLVCLDIKVEVSVRERNVF